MKLDVSPQDLDRIIEALDSHVYWQLSDQHYRSNGDVLEPGSDDPKQAGEIEACWELAERLRSAGTKLQTA
ncbi:MAG TPA: hypothetical protein VM364_12335 [Vicinamibacterales bacterium]|nr:hypothetical protein [Vicinamibacterales bacterium]